MIRVKRKVNKKIIISLILLGAFAVLLTASILLGLINNDEGSSSSNRELLEVLEGEDVHNGYNVAYPFVEDAAIQYISVSDKAHSFKLIRPDEKGDMVLYYKGRDGDQVYYPGIFGTDENIAYSTLYAIDQSDGLGMIPMVSYLCSAVGYTAFQERIPLSEDAETRAAQLASFGFTTNEYVSVKFEYTLPVEKEGDKPETATHTVKIGKNNISGYGRYFMVDDRDYIYCAATNYLDYGVQGFVSFIKPYLVTEGMSGDDSVLAAYLTQDFREWRNTIHSNLGDVVTADSQVIINAQAITPSDPNAKFDPTKGDNIDGYRYSNYEKTAFFLSNYADDPAYSRLLSTLVGSSVGVYYDHSDPMADPETALIFTLASQSKTIKTITDDKSSVRYEYKILAIESILTDTTEVTTPGTPVGDAKLLKITYTSSVGGTAVGTYYQHAIVDLSDERIPEDVRTALSAASIGNLSAPVSFTMDYTADTSARFDVEYVICDILEVYDKEGKEATVITSDSIVVYRYYLVVNGVKDEDVHVGTISLGDTDEANQNLDKLRAALVGNRISNDLEISVMTYTEYSELLYDFITYRVASVDYYVTSELVTAFGFVNASDRDPFFGESFYENKVEGKNALYGINADVCINIVKYFMGVASDSSSATSAEGLVGKETVAIGLTPEIMEKYGLYAYTVYIELPRGIYSRNDENFEDENALDNYEWRDTLSFYLYISEEQYDGTRYIASDLYDLVAIIDGDMFDFLEYDFTEFWARRSLLLTDFKNVDNIKLELNMDDLYGKYNFDITHETVFVDEQGNTYSVEPDDVYTDVYYLSHIMTSQSGDCIDTEFSKFLEEKGLDSTSLTVLYNNLKGDGSMIMGNRDTLGSANFKNLMHLIYGVYYTDMIDDKTPEERAEIAEGTPLMRFDVSLNSQGYYYTFEFHKLDDRRVMVSLYRSDPDGNKMGEAVSDFYVSTFAFKKIVRGFVDVLNGNEVDPEVGYPKYD